MACAYARRVPSRDSRKHETVRAEANAERVTVRGGSGEDARRHRPQIAPSATAAQAALTIHGQRRRLLSCADRAGTGGCPISNAQRTSPMLPQRERRSSLLRGEVFTLHEWTGAGSGGRQERYCSPVCGD